MAFKLMLVLAAVAYAQAGLIAAPQAAVSHVSFSSPLVSYGAPALQVSAPALTTQSQNILRSPGNLQQISTYSKTIDTPFSSVSKSDVRVSNPGYVAAAPVPVPVLTRAPAVLSAAPGPLIGVAYSAAPAVSHMTYTNGLGLSYAW